MNKQTDLTIYDGDVTVLHSEYEANDKHIIVQIIVILFTPDH